ncbi:hypothetical protein ABMC89_13480 [Sulfitobacter sp. HNIBRBA3233]|uniref:hypothetical protein n=1 Tax=Sulfitobacter marinivivus TaxID=3158558 RepID=UPI0032DF9E3F
MANMTKYHSLPQRVAMFIGGCAFGYVTLLVMANYDGSGLSQAGIAIFGLCSLGGFYGAFVGKQSI